MSQELLLILSKNIRMSCTGQIHPDSEGRIAFACEEWAKLNDEHCRYTDRISPDEIPGIHIVSPGDEITIEVLRGREVAKRIILRVPESGLPKPPENLLYTAFWSEQNDYGEEREYDCVDYRSQSGIIGYLKKHCQQVNP